MMSSRMLACVLVALPGIAGPAGMTAQQADPQLDLDRVLAAAEHHDAAVRHALIVVKQRRLRVDRWLVSMIPTASASLGSSAFAATTVTGEDDFGRPRTLESPLRYSGSASYQSVSASWVLFDGGRRWNDRRQALDALRGAEARLGAERLRARADATHRFYTAVQARLRLTREERALDLVARQLSATEHLFRIAAASQADLLGAQDQVAAQRRRIRLAELSMARATEVLASAIGIGDANLAQVDTVLPELFDPTMLAHRYRSAAAGSSHPAIMAAQFDLQAVRLRVRATSASRWPQIALGASFSRSISLSSAEALGILDPRNHSRSIGLTMSLPIVGYLHDNAGRQEAELELDRARIAAEQVESAVNAGIRDAALALLEAWERARAAEESRESTRGRSEMIARQYEAGITSFMTLENITEQVMEAEREAQDARIAFALAIATLEQRVGAKLHP